MLTAAAPLYAARSLPGRVAALALRMGARVDPMTYYSEDIAIAPSSWNMNVDRGRGPFVVTRIGIMPGGGGSLQQVALFRGGSPLQDGPGIPSTFFDFTAATTQIALQDGLLQAPILLFEEDLLFQFASLGGGMAGPDVYVSGFHTDDAFARYLGRTMGEHRSIGLDAVSTGETQPNIRSTRDMTASCVFAYLVSGAEPTALQVRRNTLTVFDSGVVAAPVTTLQRLTQPYGEPLAHQVAEQDTYVMRTEWGGGPGRMSLQFIGSAFYPEHA